MSKPNVNTVRAMLAERARDLAGLMTGESPFYLALTDNIPGRHGDRERDREELTICRMALEHVEFVARFGNSVQKSKQDGKFYSTYPLDFERWIASGCLGLHQEELDAYLVYVTRGDAQEII
jgi:hypothetical protein